ncbi:MAG: hypothetical protein BWK76_12455 [Desulfobulbaceae bacterium A2]|nr:MAG: hypothetical protein BWK76_12455 [Desulfobulbaceae bacterium A2]
MHQCWLHRQGAPDCLLFFAGFGMDPEPFRAIPCRDYDLLMFWDWREIAPLDPSALGRYRRRQLVAWSMGVLTAAHVLGPAMADLAAAAAVNGTLRPIDDRAGIAPPRYQQIQAALNEETLTNFYRSMFDDETAAECFLNHRPRRDLNGLRQELAALWQLALDKTLPADHFRTVVVGQRDRVIPARNQLRAWGRSRCRLLPLPHFFFSLETAPQQGTDKQHGWPSWDALAQDLFCGVDDGPA